MSTSLFSKLYDFSHMIENSEMDNFLNRISYQVDEFILSQKEKVRGEVKVVLQDIRYDKTYLTYPTIMLFDNDPIMGFNNNMLNPTKKSAARKRKGNLTIKLNSITEIQTIEPIKKTEGGKISLTPKTRSSRVMSSTKSKNDSINSENDLPIEQLKNKNFRINVDLDKLSNSCLLNLKNITNEKKKNLKDDMFIKNKSITFNEEVIQIKIPSKNKSSMFSTVVDNQIDSHPNLNNLNKNLNIALAAIDNSKYQTTKKIKKKIEKTNLNKVIKMENIKKLELTKLKRENNLDIVKLQNEKKMKKETKKGAKIQNNKDLTKRKRIPKIIKNEFPITGDLQNDIKQSQNENDCKDSLVQSSSSDLKNYLNNLDNEKDALCRDKPEINHTYQNFETLNDNLTMNNLEMIEGIEYNSDNRIFNNLNDNTYLPFHYTELPQTEALDLSIKNEKNSFAIKRKLIKSEYIVLDLIKPKFKPENNNIYQNIIENQNINSAVENTIIDFETTNVIENNHIMEMVSEDFFLDFEPDLQRFDVITDTKNDFNPNKNNEYLTTDNLKIAIPSYDNSTNKSSQNSIEFPKDQHFIEVAIDDKKILKNDLKESLIKMNITTNSNENKQNKVTQAKLNHKGEKITFVRHIENNKQKIDDLNLWKIKNVSSSTIPIETNEETNNNDSLNEEKKCLDEINVNKDNYDTLSPLSLYASYSSNSDSDDTDDYINFKRTNKKNKMDDCNSIPNIEKNRRTIILSKNPDEEQFKINNRKTQNINTRTRPFAKYDLDVKKVNKIPTKRSICELDSSYLCSSSKMIRTSNENSGVCSVVLNNSVQDLDYKYDNILSQNRGSIREYSKMVMNQTRKKFGNICFKFLRDRCTDPSCQFTHTLLDYNTVQMNFNGSPPKIAQCAYLHCLQFKRLFLEYFPIICELYGNSQDKQGLITMIKDCEELHNIFDNTLIFFRNIVNALIMCKMTTIEAVKLLIINHKKESQSSFNIISEIIIETDIIPFISYIEKLAYQENYFFPIDTLNCILCKCIETKNIDLLNIIIYYVKNKSRDVKNLNVQMLTQILKIAKNEN